MPSDDKPNFHAFQSASFNTGGCCSGLDNLTQPYGLQPAPQSIPDGLLGMGPPEPLEPVPDFISDKGWRNRAIKERAHFPAGYTYFAQLVGHDIGNSVPLDNVPFNSSSQANKRTQGEGEGITRYNLIENPLTLETVYGQGPTIATHLYDPATLKFDIRPQHTISQTFSVRFPQLRSIHDGRNRDTVMLHRITASIMKFHNTIVDEIEPDDQKLRIASSPRKLEIYSIARSHVIDVWHALIRIDLMPTILVDPQIAPSADTLSDTTLLHGVFRVFHGLPRSSYKFADQSFSLQDVLATSLQVTDEDTEKWAIDWRNFFQSVEGGNKTGVSASVTRKLVKGALNLPKLDASTANKTNPLRLNDPRISVFTDALLAEQRAQVSHARLAQDFQAKYKIAIEPKTIGSGPLFFALMVEAHLHGPDGKLGPLGSYLFSSALEFHMQAVEKMEVPNGISLSQPHSMLELLQSVNE